MKTVGVQIFAARSLPLASYEARMVPLSSIIAYFLDFHHSNN